MSTLSVLKIPDPFLRTKAHAVGRVTSEIKRLLADMTETMYLCEGVGLAATQVGIDLRLAVIDVGSGPLHLINPAILIREGSEIHEEGCLSCPNTIVKVARSRKVTVSYLDTYGINKRIVVDGLFARAAQHEIDHLAGKLITDYLNPIAQIFVARRARKKLTTP